MIDMVDSAANLISKRGTAAYEKLLDKSTIFYFMDIYVFVIDMHGKAIVDPVFPGVQGRDMLDFKDEIGTSVVIEMFRRLEESDKASISYLWPRPGQTNPSKKIAYVRKVKVDDEYVIVGSSMFVIEAIWKQF